MAKLQMLLLIDNYDSFTYNLSHYFQSLQQNVRVIRNDELTLTEIISLKPSYIVISPGPCSPNESGISLSVIEHFAGLVPILGVCLGHQCIAQFFGANVIRAPQVMHGKTSLIQHQSAPMFNHVADTFRVTRYHSLMVDAATLPDTIKVTAWTSDEPEAIVMALTHIELPIWGVQFHPESILSEFGMQLLDNFLALGVFTEKVK